MKKTLIYSAIGGFLWGGLVAWVGPVIGIPPAWRIAIVIIGAITIGLAGGWQS